jgi:hypothetical protein
VKAGSVISRVVAAVAIGIALALASPALAAAGTLDQSQTNPGTATAPMGGQSLLGQVITVGLAGNLDQADLHLRRHIPTTGSCDYGSGVTVTVRTVSGVAPGSTVLASGSVGPSGIPLGAADFVSFPVAPAPAVAVGAQVAIVAAALDASCTAVGQFPYDWSSASGDPYAGGGFFFRPSGTWMPEGTNDSAFRTFVAQPQAPTPAPPAAAGTGATGERAAALAKCKKKRSKRARRKCRRRANLLPV